MPVKRSDGPSLAHDAEPFSELPPANRSHQHHFNGHASNEGAIHGKSTREKQKKILKKKRRNSTSIVARMKKRITDMLMAPIYNDNPCYTEEELEISAATEDKTSKPPAYMQTPPTSSPRVQADLEDDRSPRPNQLIEHRDQSPFLNTTFNTRLAETVGQPDEMVYRRPAWVELTPRASITGSMADESEDGDKHPLLTKHGFSSPNLASSMLKDLPRQFDQVSRPISHGSSYQATTETLPALSSRQFPDTWDSRSAKQRL